jgi:nucleoside-diphosphate-sugar epimerase
MSDLHVIFGTGPAATWTARALLEAGHSVRSVNRTGKRPEFMPTQVEMVTVADAADAAQSMAAARGASVVYQCLNPPYQRWSELFPGLQHGVLTAAKNVGARYVSLENLYMYGRVRDPITEDSPVAPISKKGRLRASMSEELRRAHERGDIEVAIGRAADYYGPGVTASALGERTFRPLVAGKPAELMGNAETPHSYAYIEDVGRGLAVLGTRPEASGQVWILPHAPARTGRQTLAPAFAAAGLPEKVRVVGSLSLRMAGLFVPAARESIEMLYEFTEPFQVDSSKIQRAFGLAPTPIGEGMRRTVAWWQSRSTSR